MNMDGAPRAAALVALMLLAPRSALASPGSVSLFESSAGNATSIPSENGTAHLPPRACVFCPEAEGVSDPGGVVPIENRTNCYELTAFAGTLGEEDAACADLQELHDVCCPPEAEPAATPYPMETLYTKYADIKNGHIKNFIILRGVSGMVSTIGSSLILRMINKSRDGLSTTFHRILLGMSISDIVLSVSFMFFSTMSPSEMDYLVWNARGNQASCAVQGFMVIAGIISALLYSCSLNLYYLLKMKYNFSDTYVRTKIEPFLHGVPIMITLGVALALLINKNYNDNGGGNCTSPTFDPPHCVGYEDGQIREGFSIPCGQGRDGATFAYMSVVIIFLATPIIICVSLAMMYKTMRDQEYSNRKYGAGVIGNRNQENDEEAGDEEGGRKSIVGSISSIISSVRSRASSGPSSTSGQNYMRRAILYRGLAYSGSYFLTWIWAIITYVLILAGKWSYKDGSIPLPYRYVWIILSPLQGLFNFLIYMQPKVMKVRRSAGGDISWCRAFAVAFRLGITGGNAGSS